MAFTVKDLKGDFLATGVDANDASPALVSFNTWAQSQSAGVKAAGIELTVPGDGNVYSPQSTSANDRHWVRFIPLLKILGTGAAMPLLRGTQLNTFTFPTTNQCSLRVASCVAGDTTLRVLNPVADSAKLVPGRTITQSDGVVYTAGPWLHMTGLDGIGFGDPSQQFQEYVKMLGYDSGTGIITLATPLRFSYSASWPLYNSGALSGPNATDDGGPATVYVLDSSWDAELIWDNILFDSPNTLVYTFARKVTVQNCKLRSTGGVGTYGMSPTVSETVIWDNFDQADRFIEVDKSIKEFTIKNGSTVNQLSMQNASVENFFIQNSTINILNGTGQNTNISASTIGSCSVGPTAGGVGGTFTADGSTFTSITPYGVVEFPIIGPGWTCSNGVIKVPASHGAVRFAVPGAICAFQGQHFSDTAFKVFAVWRDADFTYVLTSLPDGFPNIPLQGGTEMGIAALGATAMYVTNCSGCADIVNLSQAGAYAKRFGEYTKKQYVAADTNNAFAGLFAAGRLLQININVLTPYSGAGALTMNAFGQFNNGMLAADNSAISNLGSVINCKVAGLRAITPTTVTGLQSGDTFPVPGAIWLTGSVRSYFSANVSGNGAGPVIEVETITDQGFSGAKKTICRFQ